MGGVTPAACWWCQLRGRQMAPFRSLLDPVAVPVKWGACPESMRSWGKVPRWLQLPPGSPCSFPLSRLESGMLGGGGPAGAPRAGAEGRGPQQVPLSIHLPQVTCQLLSFNTCSSISFPLLRVLACRTAPQKKPRPFYLTSPLQKPFGVSF